MMVVYGSHSRNLWEDVQHTSIIYIYINDTQRILFLSFFRFTDLCNFFSTRFLFDEDVRRLYAHTCTHAHARTHVKNVSYISSRMTADRPTNLPVECMEEEQRAHNCRSSTVGRYAAVDRRDASDHRTHTSAVMTKSGQRQYYNNNTLFVLYASPVCITIICVLHTVCLYTKYTFLRYLCIRNYHKR